MRHGHVCGDDRSLQGLMFVQSHENIDEAQPQMCCKHFMDIAHSPPALSRYLHAQCFQRNCISFERERCNFLGGSLAGSSLGMNDYRMASTHSNAI